MQLALHLTNRLIRAVAGVTTEDAFGVYAHPTCQRIRREPGVLRGLCLCAWHQYRPREIPGGHGHALRHS